MIVMIEMFMIVINMSQEYENIILILMRVMMVYDWAFFYLLHPTNPTQVDRLTCEKLHDILNSAGKWKATPQTAVGGQRSDTFHQGHELAWWIVHNHLISLVVQCCSLRWPFPNTLYKSPQ